MAVTQNINETLATATETKTGHRLEEISRKASGFMKGGVISKDDTAEVSTRTRCEQRKWKEKAKCSEC